MGLQPAFDSSVFVSRVVVADQVDFFVGRYRLIDHAQELEPFLMTVFLLTQAEDFAIGGVQRGKQGGRAVALVIVRHGCAAALLHRQAGLGAVQGLYLALLVYRQHQRMLGRIEIEPHDGFQLACELRVATHLETIDAMRLEAVGPPYTRDRSFRDTRLFGHGAGGPLRGVVGRLLCGLRNQSRCHFRSDRRSPSGARGILQQTLHSQFQKTAAPQGDHARSNLETRCNLLVLKTIGRQKHDTAAHHNPRRYGSAASQLLQPPPDVFVHNNGPGHTHIEISSS